MAIIGSPVESIESAIITLVQWLKLCVETLGAGIVGVGVCVALTQLIRTVASRQPAEFNAVRLTVARYLALALEFELGADILGTAISPTGPSISPIRGTLEGPPIGIMPAMPMPIGMSAG